MDVYLGVILAVAYNFAPRGWMKCEGQLLSIAQNSALFSLLGTQYGGDGQNTFALPDLRGRVAAGAGQGAGLQPIVNGQMMGTNTTTTPVNGAVNISIPAASLPKHTHGVHVDGSAFAASSTLNASDSTGGATAPAEGAALGNTANQGAGQAAIYVTGKVPAIAMNSASVSTKVSGTVNLTSDANDGTGAAFQAPFASIVTSSVMQPTLGLTYIIAVEGMFPSRN
jgi:microcystin-dependent protein